MPLLSNLVHKHADPGDALAVPAASSASGALRGAPARLAPLVGLVHGAAGLGGVLGVVPAERLRDPGAAATYLGAFCAASTLAMGGFAACCAAVADWLAGDGGGDARRASRVEGGAAFLSAAVGLAWLGLLATGRLATGLPA